MIQKLILGILAIMGVFSFNSKRNNVQADIVKDNGKNLIIYFSWSGSTEEAAKAIQKYTQADIVELKPQKAYPKDYDNLVKVADNQRLKNIHPAIKTKIKDFSSYQTVYVGFPTWWHQPPMIIYSLFDKYDFNGKTIIPFTTSMSDSIEKSMPEMKELAEKDNAKIITGFRYNMNNKSLEKYLVKNKLIK